MIDDLNLENSSQYATKLADSTLHFSDRIEILQSVQSKVVKNENQAFADTFMPILCMILCEEQVSFDVGGDAYRFRVKVIETLGRIPVSVWTKSFASQLVQAFLRVMIRDNEEIGGAALGLLHGYVSDPASKSAIPAIGEELMPSILALLENMLAAVTSIFEDPAQPLEKRFLYNFKGMTSLPKLVASIVVSGLSIIQESSLQQFTDLLIRLLEVGSPEQLAARANGLEHCISTVPSERKASHIAWKAFSIKLVNPVLFYLRKTRPQIFEPYRSRLVASLLAHVLEMPDECGSVRREALNNIRLIVNSHQGGDLRSYFAPHFDILLNDSLMLGKSVTTRALCEYTCVIVVADLVVGIRKSLTVAQSRRVLFLFLKKMHDLRIPQQAALHSFKLIILLFEHLTTLKSEPLPKDEAREYIVEFIRTVTERIKSMNELFKQVCYMYRNGSNRKRFSIWGSLDLGVPFYQQCSSDGVVDVTAHVQEMKMMFRLMVNSLKHALAALAMHYNPPVPANVSPESWNSTARGFKFAEYPIFSLLLRQGLLFFDYMHLDDFDENGEWIASSNPQTSPLRRKEININKEDQDAVETLSQIFSCLDPSVLLDSMSSNLDHVFELTVRNDYIPFFLQHFVLLTTNNISYHVSAMLFEYMRKHLKKLGEGNATVAAALIRWLKLLCSGMAVYGSKNDSILQPHLPSLIMSCIKLPKEAKDPIQFFAFLRILFRSISGGKFENLYNQIVPIMPELLQSLSELLATAHRPQLKDILVELILTVPVRLSHLLPYLSYLMRPLVYALQQRHGEMVSHALKTLDLILDNLAEQYLNPILSPYRQELMAALFKHLRPPPYKSGLSHPTVKLLGKLSGRNRKWLKDAPELAFHESCDPGLQAVIRVVDAAEAVPKTFAFDRVLETVKVLLETTAVEGKYRLLGYDFARGCLPLLFELDIAGDDFQAALLERIDQFKQSLGSTPKRKRAWDEGATSYSGPPIQLERKLVLEKSVSTIIECLALSCRLDEVKAEAKALLQDVSRHFALLYLEETTDVERPFAVSPRPLDLLTKKQMESLLPNILNRMRQQMTMDLLVNKTPSSIEGFADSITKVLCQDENSGIAESMLQTVYDVLLLFLKDEEVVSGLAIWSSIADKCCASFDKSPWYVKNGGVKGLKFLINGLKLGRVFLLSKQPTIVKALLALIREPAPETVLDCVSNAQELLFAIIEICHSQTGDKLSSSSAYFRPMVNHLVAALSDSSEQVRQTVHKALALLSQVTGLTVYSLTSKSVEDRLLIPIFSKPLRALPFGKQIVHMDAITFCLNQEPPLVPFSDGFHRFLVEVISIADAEDQGLLNKSQKLKSTMLLSDLRVACLQFLAAARMHSSLFNAKASENATSNSSSSASTPKPPVTAVKDSTNNETRIYTIYLKYLVYSDSDAVVEAAVAGLLQLMKVQRPPKEILPQALKPVLQNLTNPKDLTLQSLIALKRLLGPLLTFFKAELGNRLLDHLKFWAEHADFTTLSQKHISQVDSVKLIVGLLDIFNSLSGSASVFLPELVTLTIEKLDVCISRTRSSPFRETLVKYLVKYPDITVSFFLENLAKPAFVDFFLDILLVKNKDGTPVFLSTLLEHLALIFQRMLEQPELVIPGSRVLIKLVELEGASRVLGNDQGAAVLQLILDKWDVVEFPNNARILLRILMQFYESQPNHGSLLSVILQSIDHPLVLNTLPVQQFLYSKIIEPSSTSADQQLVHMEQFVAQWDSVGASGNFSQVPASSWKQLHNLLSFVLIPLVLKSGSESMQKLLNQHPDIGLQLSGHLWGPLSVMMDGGSQPLLYELEEFLLELQGLTYWLMDLAGPSLVAIRKELIKFTWVSMKAPDVIMKATAALVSAQFSACYETPSRIAYIVYTNLLQSVSGESLALVRRGIKLLTPRLPALLFPDSGFTQRLLEQLVKFVKDETPCSSLYADIFCPYADIWSQWREQLSPLLLQYFAKTLASVSSDDDSNNLYLDLIKVVHDWFKDVESPSETKKAIGNSFISLLTKYLTTTFHTTTQNGTEVAPNDWSKNLVNRGLELLEMGTRTFSDFTLDDDCFTGILYNWTRLMSGVAQNTTLTPRMVALSQAFTRLGQVLAVLAKADFSRVSKLCYPVLQCVCSCNWLDLSVAKSFAPLFELLADRVTLPKIVTNSEMDIDEDTQQSEDIVSMPSEPASIINKEPESIEDRIGSVLGNWIYKNLDGNAKSGWSNTFFLCLVSAFAKSGGQNTTIDHFLPILVKWLQALVKEHVNNRSTAGNATNGNSASSNTASLGTNAAATSSIQQPAGTSTSAAALAATTQKSQGLSFILHLMSKRCIFQTSPLRKTFLVQLYSIIDKSVDVALLRQILNFAVDLVFENKAVAFPTLKEKAMLLSKMFIFEFRADRKLLEEYLQAILRVYNDPELSQTELTSYLENAFLLGIKSENYLLRRQFAAKLDSSVLPSVSVRLTYLFGVQSWEPLANTFWIRQMLDMLFGSVESNVDLYKCVGNYRLAHLGHTIYELKPTEEGESASRDSNSMVLRNSKRASLRSSAQTTPKDADMTPVDSSDTMQLLIKHWNWLAGLKSIKLELLLNSCRQIIYLDNNLAAETWTQLFPLCWSVLSHTQRQAVGRMLTQVLVKDYHVKQADMRPNCVQTLIESVARCYPTLALPPFVLRSAGCKFNAWHAALEILINSTPELRVGGLGQSKDDEKIREQSLDAIGVLYDELGEDDYYYGLWKRRCNFSETNVALSFEQLGMWTEAQIVLEKAQAFARGSGAVASGSVPFCESEYSMWETHWIHCAKQLQQWDILADLAKQEGNHNLLLECAWRLSDFVNEREHLERTFASLGESLSLHGKLCETFFVLANGKGDDKSQREFNSMTEEVVQLALRKWHMLPSLPSSVLVTGAHLPLLHLFQLLIELGDARSIQSSLLQTGPNNIESKAAEIKTLLDRWRWRLPNMWDDVSMWSDLVSWRQHVFTMLNKKYIPIAQSISQLNPTQNVSYLYKGYHETAWMINRFAHMLRKSHMTQVCLQQLNKIYTLPNIEIQEAFYKLREHARCFLQDPNSYVAGLEVINNTNLTYFLPVQKAEFMTLRGQFLALLNRPTDAFQSFSQGLRLNDLAKGWQQWGLCNCNLLKDDPSRTEYGIHAMECCLKAANVFNNHRARPMLAKSLWLLVRDDAQGTFAQIFSKHAPHTPIWFWNTFIPQLLNGLANSESAACKFVLQRLAKTYPQSLFFPLRTMSDDLSIYKKALTSSGSSTSQSGHAKASASSEAAKANDPPSVSSSTGSGGEVDASKDDLSISIQSQASSTGAQSAKETLKDQNALSVDSMITTLKHCDDISATLKTATPLLALSMESLCDQIITRLKLGTDEDIYRLIVTFYNEQASLLASRVGNPNDDLALSLQTRNNLARFAGTMYPNHIKYQEAFKRAFIDSKPDLPTLLARLRQWRDHLELMLDSRPEQHVLTHFSPYLAEFEHSKFDDIEVPGQYLQLKDSNVDFIRIDNVENKFTISRGHTACHRTLIFRGHDGHAYPYKIVNPTPRSSRREERLVQFYTLVNDIFEHRRECRRRRLQIHLPYLVPISNVVRLASTDMSYVSLYQIYENFCAKANQNKDLPYEMFVDGLSQFVRDGSKSPEHILNFKVELLEQIANEVVPDTVLSMYFSRKMKTVSDFWHLRKQFTTSLAASEFMNYSMAIANRTPQKIFVSCRTGNVLGEELWPNFSPSEQVFRKDEAVPFKLTPNIQNMLTLVGVEGVYTTVLVVLARALLEKRSEDLDAYLPLLIRDALIFYSTGYRTPVKEGGLPNYIYQSMDAFMQRLDLLSCGMLTSPAPANVSTVDTTKPVNRIVIEMIAKSTNPVNLASMDPNWMPWF